jgi:hypothetical protein
MNIVEFEDLLDRLGDDLSRWPAGQQQAASVLLAESSEARDLLHEAQALRGLLSPVPVRAPPGLADRIVNDAMKRSPPGIQSESVSIFGRAWNIVQANLSFGRLAFLSACFVAGLFGGVLHNMTSAPKPAFEANDFSAYLPSLPYTVE